MTFNLHLHELVMIAYNKCNQAELLLPTQSPITPPDNPLPISRNRSILPYCVRVLNFMTLCQI